MLVEQVLHIMQNQDYPRFCIFFDRKYMYFLHYAILGGMENMGKAMQTFAKPSSQPSE